MVVAAKEVIVHVNGARVSVIVVKDNGTIRAYVNSCPHARTPLNWREDKFFDLSRDIPVRAPLYGAKPSTSPPAAASRAGRRPRPDPYRRARGG